jgi:hypothetical protein
MSWLAQQLSASQERPCSVKSVTISDMEGLEAFKKNGIKVRLIFIIITMRKMKSCKVLCPTLVL